MAAKAKYNPEYHDNWAWSLAAMGATNEEIASAFGVAPRTIIRWVKAHQSFEKSINEGKHISDAKVIRSLYERAVGFEYTETKKIVEMDPNGGVKPVKVETVTKRALPDVGAAAFWLKNRQRDKWKDRPEPLSTEGDSNQVSFYLPDNGRDGGAGDE